MTSSDYFATYKKMMDFPETGSCLSASNEIKRPAGKDKAAVVYSSVQADAYIWTQAGTIGGVIH
jgi:hypothetical protein